MILVCKVMPLEITPIATFLSPSDRVAKCSVLLTQYCEGDKVEKNEMGWTCGAYG